MKSQVFIRVSAFPRGRPELRHAGRLLVVMRLLAMMDCGTLAAPATNLEATLPTLTTAHAAHSLTTAEAARRFPVHLRTVVTYYDPSIDPRRGAIFSCDSTGCIFISVPSKPILPIRAGTLIEIQGTSAAGDFAPIVEAPTVRVVGESPLPENPPRVSLTQLLTGTLDGQWVEIEGLVRSVDESGANETLTIAVSDGLVSATTVREKGIEYSDLIDARVVLRASVAPFFSQNRQIIGVD